MFILDTSVLIELEKKNPEIMEKIQELIQNPEQDLGITATTYGEFYFGCLADAQKRKDATVKQLEKYQLFNTTKNSAKLFAELKFETEKKGKKIPTGDLWIASMVLDNNSTLITKDEHFKEIKELKTVFV